MSRISRIRKIMAVGRKLKVITTFSLIDLIDKLLIMVVAKANKRGIKK